MLDRTLERESAVINELQALLDQAGKPADAAEQVRALMFIRRFRADVEARLVALENN